MVTGFNLPGMVVARLFVGAFDAGFTPVIPLYLSFWYTRRELGVRIASVVAFGAVAGAFSGLIAFGVQSAHTAIANWKLLFIVEGIPAVLMGIFTVVFLPNRQEETSFLNEDERKIQSARRDRGVRADVGRTVNKSHVIAALKDWKLYMAGVIHFGANCAMAANSAFLPTIIKTFGATNARAQLLTVPPYAVCAVVLVILSYVSDRLQSRGILMSGAAFFGGIGYLLLLTVSDNHVRYFATFCILTSAYSITGLSMPWFAHNLGSESKTAAGIPMYTTVGQCGSILGSHLFPTTDGPRYIRGFAVACALEFLAAVCGVVLTVYYRLENRRRDRKYGVPEFGAAVDTSVLADEAPTFRYVP